MTKAAMRRLLGSEFFHEVLAVVNAWDYYISTGDRGLADEMMREWQMAKSALKHITGTTYMVSRNGETYSIVNEQNPDDELFTARSVMAAGQRGAA